MSYEFGSSKQRNRTKEHLKDALIVLIKEKGFHTLSVKDIVNYASYNRSTFYLHYQDKFELAEDLLNSMLQGLEDSVGKSYNHGQNIQIENLPESSVNIIFYIYKFRHFFELIKFEDTLPGIHTKLPQSILKIYQEQFIFKTINNIPVDMNYFKRYTAYGFYGLILNWITSNFEEPQENFVKELIALTKTHINSFEYTGK